ncbi:MAG: hypothetical protein QJR02_08310 [Sinobacteraceae bacterium]|nr:hypothetical protein [Nevskiaceae bacterium]
MFLVDQEARRFADLISELPPALPRLVLEYLHLFHPAQRVLTWPRALRLLEPLAAAIRRGQVERHGRAWAAPSAAWRAAIEQMLTQRAAGKLRLPLRDHAYLFEIIAASQARVEADREQQLEERRRTAAMTRAAQRTDDSEGPSIGTLIGARYREFGT